jgi:hypothetical protein
MIHLSSEKISFLVPFVSESRMESRFTAEGDVWYIPNNVVGSDQSKEFECVLNRSLHWAFCLQAGGKFLDGPPGFANHPNVRLRGFLWTQRSPLDGMLTSRVIGTNELKIPNNNLIKNHYRVGHDHPSCRKVPKRYTPVRILGRTRIKASGDPGHFRPALPQEGDDQNTRKESKHGQVEQKS